jgi:DNA-binding MarR family transcriptional regulator
VLVRGRLGKHQPATLKAGRVRLPDTRVEARYAETGRAALDDDAAAPEPCPGAAAACTKRANTSRTGRTIEGTMTITAPPAARWLSEDQQRVWRAWLLGTSVLNERLDAQLREHDLDLAEYEILVTLSESADRQLRMAELADAVHQSRSRLTHTVTRMEKRGLIERTTCPVDRRGVWANLTDAGQQLLTEAAPSHVECVRRNFVDAVDPDDYAALGRAMRAILEAPQA